MTIDELAHQLASLKVVCGGDMRVIMRDDWAEFDVGLVRHEAQARSFDVSTQQFVEGPAIVLYSTDTPEARGPRTY